MTYAKHIGILAVVLLGIYTAFGTDSELNLEEQIAQEIEKQNIAIDKQNDLLIRKYQEQMIQCTSTASWTHTEVLSQLESCAKMEKPTIIPRVWSSNPIASVSTGSIDTPIVWPLRKDLWLTDCRFTNANHELRWYSWIAYDIACEVGKSFDVKAPTSKSEWIVSAVWFEPNCGDYVVLRHADIYFQFCHTQTSRNKWDRVKAGDIVWQVNLSWETSAMHLHVAIIRLIWDTPYFLSTDLYYNGSGDMISAKPLFDMYPDLKFDRIKSKPTASSGWA